PALRLATGKALVVGDRPDQRIRQLERGEVVQTHLGETLAERLQPVRTALAFGPADRLVRLERLGAGFALAAAHLAHGGKLTTMPLVGAASGRETGPPHSRPEARPTGRFRKAA